MKTPPPDWAVSTKALELAIDQGAYWDADQGDRIIRFAYTVYRPQYLAGEFAPLEWQERYLRVLYSFRNQDGTRLIRFSNLHCSKKNGKNLIGGIIAAYELVGAGEPSPFVVSASVSKDNAGQVYQDVKHTLEYSGLGDFCQFTNNQKRIKVPSTNAEFRSLASDGDRVQGYNASCVILDECHAHKSSGLYDSLKYATIARPNGLVVAISTAGDDPTSYYHGIYTKSKAVLSGADLDTTYYPCVFESDPDADPEDLTEWYKANPSLGTSFTEAQFGRDMLAAKSSADRSEWWRFLRYRLNRWVRSDDQVYFDVSQWDRGKWETEVPGYPPDGDLPDLSRLDCWVGVDLSLSTDPSSVIALWKLGDRTHYVRSWAWVAEDAVKYREKQSLPRYNQFVDGGCMEWTPGDRSDHDLIKGHILDLCTQYRVHAVVFDATGARAMETAIEAAGYPVVEVRQNFANYNGPMKELSKAIAERRIRHDGTDWLRYNLSVLRIQENRDGFVRPWTKGSNDHIDGAMALLMAYSAALQAPAETEGGVVWV